MTKSVRDILALIKEQDIKMVDFKMVDINGQYRHVTIPAQNFSEDTIKSGIGFDASNYGYAIVEKSDMVFIPDPDKMCIRDRIGPHDAATVSFANIFLYVVQINIK